MKRVCLLASAAVFTLASHGLAQETPPKADPQPAATEALPAAASLFEKHIAAVGGVDAIKSEKNRLVRATYSIPARSAEGSMRVLRVAPDRISMFLEIPGIITQESWCNPDGAWSRDSNNGARRLTGDSLAEMRMQAEFLGEANYQSRYKEITTLAREKLDTQDVYVVQATPHAGKARKIYFDVATGLLAGIRNTGPTGPDSDPMTTYSDYKKYGAVLHPTKAVTKVGGVEVSIITITKIESNLAVMPSIDPPDEVKAVK